MTSVSVNKALSQHNVVPDVIPAVLDNVQLLNITYPGDSQTITPGQDVKRKLTLSKPTIRFDGAQQGQEYVLIMV